MPSASTGTGARRIGAYLPVPPSAIDWAISVQREELALGNVKPIGEILLEREQITHQNLADALERQRIDCLRQCHLLVDLSDPDLAWINEHSLEVSLATGQDLMKQDERGDSIYALLSGRLLIYRKQEHMDGIPVGVAIPGDFLGDTDYFSHGNRRISASAMEPALLLKIRYEWIRQRRGASSAPVPGIDEDLLSLLGTGPWPGPGAASPAAAVPAASDFGMEALMERITQRAARVLDADRAILFLLDQESGGLCTRVANGDEIRTFKVQAGTEIAGFVTRTGDLVNLQEAYLDDRFNPAIDIWTGYWTRTLLAGPTRDPRGVIIGVIQVVNKNKGFFNADDEVLFRAFAHESANAVLTCLPSNG